VRKKTKLSKPSKKSKSRASTHKRGTKKVLRRLQKTAKRKTKSKSSRRRTTRNAALRFKRKVTTKLLAARDKYITEAVYFKATKGNKAYATKAKVIEVVKTLSKKARKKNRASGKLDAYEVALQVDYTNKAGKRARKWVAAVGRTDDEIIQQINESELLQDFKYKQYKDDGTEIVHTLATGFKITGFSHTKITQIE